MRYCAITLLLFIGTNVTAQFNYREAVPAVPNKTIYHQDFDFDALDGHVDFQSLVGEELYFAQRSVLPGTAVDSVTPFTNMICDRYTPVALMLPAGFGNGASFGNWELRDASLPGIDYRLKRGVNGNRFIAGTDYSTLIYKPMVKLWPAARAIDVATPYAAVENRYFKIVACHDSELNQYGFCYVVFNLRDTDNTNIQWVVHTRDVQRQHAHFKGFLLARQRDYVGKVFYGKQGVVLAAQEKYGPAPGMAYTCTELTFIKTPGGGPADPFLIFTDTTGKELAVPLTKGHKGPQLADFVTRTEHKMRPRIADGDTTMPRPTATGQKEIKEQKARRLRLERKYGKATARLIMKKEVQLGLLMAVCREAWGPPPGVTKTMHRGIVTETWRYGSGRWLKFDDGVLVAFGY